MHGRYPKQGARAIGYGKTNKRAGKANIDTTAEIAAAMQPVKPRAPQRNGVERHAGLAHRKKRVAEVRASKLSADRGQ